MTSLQPHETALVGQWISTDDEVVADAVAKRIESLIKTDLVRVAAAAGGWESLYRDRRDGRFWELTYPHSGWHGGGPPALTYIPVDSARSKYNLQ